MLKPLPEIIREHNLKIKGVIHIGGHQGQEYSYYASEKIPNITFVEPHPTNFQILEKNVGPECKLFNVALGNTQGTVEMFVEEANQGQSSSILEPYLHRVQYPQIEFLYKIDVPITLLDLLSIDRTKYNFINIDVQGYELNVFMGGTDILKHIDYIYTEINFAELYVGCAQADELDEFLNRFGFKRVETWMACPTWGDALYIKQ